MHSEFALGAATISAFLLVLTRVSSVFVFVPLPGLASGLQLPRIVVSLAVTLVLQPAWPAVSATPTPAELLAWIAAEAAFGLTLGLAIGFVTETVLLGFQIVSLQAGFGYASLIDPITNSDSGVLLLAGRLASGLLFLLLGLDRLIVRTFAESLAAWPPGSFSLSQPLAYQVIQLGSAMFSTGLRLVLPAVGLLAIIDLAVALVSKMHSQLQLMGLLFPAKILLSLAVLSATLIVFPSLFANLAEPLIRFLHTIATRG
jgi:flagellar biosynthetic protein FliR